MEKTKVKNKKRKLIIGIVIICTLFVLISSLGIYALCVNFAKISLSIDPSKTFQTMEGFGSSMAWTVQKYGNNEAMSKEIAELLYGNDGMKLNIYRYNVGAGTKEIDSGYWPDERATESFFDSSKFVDMSSFSDETNYDFSKDSAATNFFEDCLDTGNVKTLILFANSPHYLMTKNNKGNGDVEYECNLSQENYGAFSDYLLIIAQHFYDLIKSKNETVKIYISPVNEPQWRWNGNNQEGCHFEPDELAKFYDVFYTKLKAYNSSHNTDFYPEFFESGSYVSQYKKYIKEFKKYDFYSEIESLAFHSYHADDSKILKDFFSFYQKHHLADKVFQMSEWCEMEATFDNSIETGLYTAKVIMQDLTLLSSSMWCYWLGVSGYEYEDGLVYLNHEDWQTLDQSIRFYTMAHFSRFISKGDVRISLSTGDILSWGGLQGCAFKKQDGSIVIVLLNERNYTRKLKLPKDLVIDQAWLTDENHKLAQIELQNNCTLNAKSITTIICKQK